MKINKRAPLVLTAFMYVLCAAATAPAAFSQEKEAEPRITIDLSAKNFRFSEKEISVPAGVAVVIRFSNRDEGIPHTFSVYTDKSARSTIFKGDVVPGDAKAEFTFTAPTKPGTYFFRCDIHPAQMNGAFIVEQ